MLLRSGRQQLPLTTWASISSRFDQVAAWAPYGGPGGYNDYDSLEIGNGANNGLTPDERRTQLSLWSLAASPLVLGTDLTHLDPADLALLKNHDVLAVDQDGIDARRISSDTESQVFAKTEPGGDVVVGLFNTSSAPREVVTTAAALGLSKACDYGLRDLWSHRLTESTGRIAADVPAHGVVLYRVHGSRHTVTGAAPDVSLALDWAPAPSDSTARTVTAVLSDNGSRSVTDAAVNLTGPSGTKITARSVTRARTVRGGHALQATYSVSIPSSEKLFDSNAFQGTASYRYRSTGTTRLRPPVTRSPSTTKSPSPTGRSPPPRRPSASPVPASAFRRRARTCTTAPMNTARSICRVPSTTVR